jgi:uncharacterized protein with NRDE domain
MCIIFILKNQLEDYPLVLLSNRDEFQNRDTQYLHKWDTKPIIYGGRDLKEGGTWLGVNEQGYFAALTNVRDLKSIKPDAPSRGNLLVKYLSNPDGDNLVNYLTKNKNIYNPYNLIFGDRNNLFVYSNHNDKLIPITSGIHGLSNAYLNSNWKKVSLGKKKLKSIIHEGWNFNLFFELLKNEEKANFDELPDTGIGIEKEIMLSSIFIRNQIYGTRSSTVVLFHKTGKIQMVEKNFSISGEMSREINLEFL